MGKVYLKMEIYVHSSERGCFFFNAGKKKDGYILGRLDMFCRKIYVQCKVK